MKSVIPSEYLKSARKNKKSYGLGSHKEENCINLWEKAGWIQPYAFGISYRYWHDNTYKLYSQR